MSDATEKTTEEGIRLGKIEAQLAEIIERMPKPGPEEVKDVEVPLLDERLGKLHKAASMSSKHNQRFVDQMKQAGAGPQTLAIVCVIQSFPKLAEGVLDLLIEGTKPIVDAIEAVHGKVEDK